MMDLVRLATAADIPAMVALSEQTHRAYETFQATERGAAQIVVVCGHVDAPKRAFLARHGLTIASEWYTVCCAKIPGRINRMDRMKRSF